MPSNAFGIIAGYTFLDLLTFTAWMNGWYKLGKRSGCMQNWSFSYDSRTKLQLTFVCIILFSKLEAMKASHSDTLSRYSLPLIEKLTTSKSPKFAL